MMTYEPIAASGSVFVPNNWWDEMQAELYAAAELCKDITAQIANHQHNGEYKAEELIDSIDGRVRTIRKAIERRLTPI
jgi:hypothetical protein